MLIRSHNQKNYNDFLDIIILFCSLVNSISMHQDDNMAYRRQGKASSLQDDQLTKNEMCGCFLIGYPQWLQRLASNKLFVLIIALQICCIAFFSSMFQTSLTTIETRYQMSISELGLFTSMFTAGSIVSTVFVTYFGGRPTSRRPVWLAVGGLLLSLGMFIHTLPQFIFSPYQPPSSGLFTSSDSNASEFPTGLCATDRPTGDMNEEDVSICDEEDRQILMENNVAFIFFIIAEIMVGLGWGPQIPVALSYVDDSASTGTTGLVSGRWDCRSNLHYCSLNFKDSLSISGRTKHSKYSR